MLQISLLKNLDAEDRIESSLSLLFQFVAILVTLGMNSYFISITKNTTTGFGQRLRYDTTPAYKPVGDELLPIHSTYRGSWFIPFIPSSNKHLTKWCISNRGQKDEATALQELMSIK